MRPLRRIFVIAALMGVMLGPAHAAQHFPTLTGRVVDAAHLLSTNVQTSLEAELANFESATHDQLVVVTVPSLEGQSIEEYGLALGRHWGIGQQDANNGVLLIVAPHERKVRIEVGYGLEGTLTDAVTSQIIQTIILPAFKQGNMQQGIIDGTHAIIAVEHGGKLATQAPTSMNTSDHSTGIGIVAIVILLFLFSQILLFVFYVTGSILAFILSLFGFHAFRRWLDGMKTRIFPADRAFLFWLLMPSGRITGSGGGGFSGGGGSFGGGGSSGSW